MSRKIDSDKYLVVEQKGWRILILGLLISIGFSLTFRAVFSPRRIQYEIERALGAADSRVKSQLDGAYLSLSNGLWPRLAIVIDHLKLQTSDPCLFEAKAEISNLVLPIDISSLMARALIFKQIEVGVLNLEMNSKAPNCESNNAILPKVESPNISSNNPGKKDNFERPPLVQTMSVESSFINEILFSEINLKVKESPIFHWKFKKLNLKLPTVEQTKTIAEGVVSLISDHPDYPIQGLHANLEVQYDPEGAHAKINGAWREGRIEVEGDWNSKEKLIDLHGNLIQIPWSQIMILAKGLGQTEPLPLSSQSWVSGKVHWKEISHAETQLEFQEGHVEGELGDLLFGLIKANKTLIQDQWKVEPYAVLFRSLNLDLLAKMSGTKEVSPTIQQLGFLDGEANFIENKLNSVHGQWKDLQFIFSSRGHREVQSIRKMNVEISENNNRWLGQINDIEIDEGSGNGKINIEYNQDNSETHLTSQFDGLKLNSDVEDLMTQNGSISELDGKINLDLAKGKIKEIEGSLHFDKAVFDEVDVLNARIEFDGKSDDVSGRVQIQSLNWPQRFLSYWPLTSDDKMENLLIKSISGKFEKMSNELDVKDIQGFLGDSKSKLLLNFGWTSDDLLHGELQVKADRKVQTFKLSGTRKNPEWQNGPRQ